MRGGNAGDKNAGAERADTRYRFEPFARLALSVPGKYSSISLEDLNHDAAMRIGGEPLSHGVCRSRCRVVGCVVSDGHCAGRKATPCGTSPTATKRHNAISNLCAKATIITLRVA